MRIDGHDFTAGAPAPGNQTVRGLETACPIAADLGQVRHEPGLHGLRPGRGITIVTRHLTSLTEIDNPLMSVEFPDEGAVPRPRGIQRIDAAPAHPGRARSSDRIAMPVDRSSDRDIVEPQQGKPSGASPGRARVLYSSGGPGPHCHSGCRAAGVATSRRTPVIERHPLLAHTVPAVLHGAGAGPPTHGPRRLRILQQPHHRRGDRGRISRWNEAAR